MIGWFARNDVAANFLMIGIVFIGIWTAMHKIPLEVQPSMRFQEVWVNVDYRGGSPDDVERAVVLPIELALEGLPGVFRPRPRTYWPVDALVLAEKLAELGRRAGQ